MKTFISSADRSVAERLVELLRLHYIEFFYSDRTIKGGYFAEDIEQAIAKCQRFIVLVSPSSLASDCLCFSGKGLVDRLTADKL